jgi:hypothetical protein
MFGLMIPPSWYIYLALTLTTILGFGYGKYESAKYDTYVAKVDAAGKAQEAKNEIIKKQSEIVNKGIKNEYEAKLAAVRNYYTLGVRPPSGSTMSGISTTTQGADANPPYSVLIGQCAQTTAQLTSLQDWVNTQVGLK